MGNQFSKRRNNDTKLNYWEKKEDGDGDSVFVYKGGLINENEKHTIRHVQIHASVIMIPDHAFRGCINLRTIHFPTTLQSIGTGSFYNCSELIHIDLSASTSLVSIHDDAFFGCIKLTTVSFPKKDKKATLEEIGVAAFCNCQQLTSINLQDTCIEKIEITTFYCCTNLTRIYFPSATKIIGYGSFDGCTGLMSLANLQDTNIEEIESWAFSLCIGLIDVTFPKTLRRIGYGTFYGCHQLKSIIGLSTTAVTTIESSAFSLCPNLERIDVQSTSFFLEDDDDEDTIENVQTLFKKRRSTIINLPMTLIDVGPGYIFGACPKLKDVINTNSFHFGWDINRGGGYFLHRQQQQHHYDLSDDTSTAASTTATTRYPSSLWPLILYRILNEMKLPKQRICIDDDKNDDHNRNDDEYNFDRYTNNDIIRRMSVAHHLLVHGVTMDLISSL